MTEGREARRRRAPAEGSPARRRGLDSGLDLLVALLFVVVLLVLFFTRVGLVEAVANLRWQLALSTCVLVLIALLRGRRRLALGLLLLLPWAFRPALEPLLSARPDAEVEEVADGAFSSSETGTRPLVVAAANILWFNRDPECVPTFLKQEKADVLALEEVSPWWRDHVEERLVDHPHRVFWPEDRKQWHRMTWGVGIVSRWPLEEVRRIVLSRRGERSFPLLEARVRPPGRPPFLVRAIHIPRPALSVEEWVGRQEVFAGLGRLDWSGEVVFLGDLNTTCSSPLLRGLIETSGLRDTRAGFGMLQTWPRSLARLNLGLTIDHVFVGGALRCIERRRAELPGSDHYAAVAQLR